MRAATAAALSTVEGVNGFERRPATARAGSAWSTFGGGARAAGTAFMTTWNVFVVVPQDEDAAVEWFDARWEALFFALEDVGYVASVVPVLLPVPNAGELKAYQIVMNIGE
jgi:hypothetical protein